MLLQLQYPVISTQGKRKLVCLVWIIEPQLRGTDSIASPFYKLRWMNTISPGPNFLLFMGNSLCSPSNNIVGCMCMSLFEKLTTVASSGAYLSQAIETSREIASKGWWSFYEQISTAQKQDGPTPCLEEFSLKMVLASITWAPEGRHTQCVECEGTCPQASHSSVRNNLLYSAQPANIISTLSCNRKEYDLMF